MPLLLRSGVVLSGYNKCIYFSKFSSWMHACRRFIIITQTLKDASSTFTLETGKQRQIGQMVNL